MLVNDPVRVSRNRRKCEIAKKNNLSENRGSSYNSAMSNQKDDVNSETKARIRSQADENEQMMRCITPQTKQLKDLTRVIQGMSSAQQANI